MGDAQMELGEREFKKIGEYVKSHLKEWIAESEANLGAGEQRPAGTNPKEEAFAIRRRELDLVERVVRVEDELKNLREVMEERFQKVDERFEAQRELMVERFGRIDERFSKMDERFEAQRELMDERFSKMDERFEAQRELMDERFKAQQNQIDTRFEAQQKMMNERFDHMEKRTSFSQWIIGIGFTAVGVLMLVLNYFG